MTGTHGAGPEDDAPASAPARPPRRSRSLAWRVGTPVVALLSGALFVVSAADSGGTDLRPGRYTDLASLAEAEADDVEDLQDRVQDLDEDIDDLTAEVDDWGVARIRGQVAQLEDPAGFRPRRGPGLTITMSDSPGDLLDDAVEAGYDRDQLVVHQQDLQAVVNALWRGGATAVTLAGERIITTTGIKCEGNAVQLDGVPYPQPFVIQAVGDPEALVEAVEGDPIVTGYRADAANPLIQIGWDLEEEQEVEAPAYDGILALRYAEPVR